MTTAILRQADPQRQSQVDQSTLDRNIRNRADAGAVERRHAPLDDDHVSWVGDERHPVGAA